jgi:hypothetical protein
MDVEWPSKLMFFTDLCLHLNELNSKLQGFNKTVIVMFDLIKAFEAKLNIFDGDVILLLQIFQQLQIFSEYKKNFRRRKPR